MRSCSCSERVVAVTSIDCSSHRTASVATNFVFARHPDHKGEALMKALRERAVLVRQFAKPRISDFLRITIGTDAECARLIEALDEIL